MSGASVVSEKDRTEAGRETLRVKQAERRLLESLMLIGESEAMQRLRRQVQVMGPHLRGAVVEAEPGLGAALLAGELHRLSGGEGTALWSMNAGAADAWEQCKLAETEGSVLLRGLPGATAGVQRRVLELMRGSRAGRGPTRWLVLTEDSVKSLATQGQLQADLVRAMPAVTIRIPPLRERRGDLAMLAAKAVALLRGDAAGLLNREAVEVLEAHGWRKNLEELIRSLRVWVETTGGSARELAAVLQQPGRVELKRAEVEMAEGPVLLQAVIDQHLQRVMQRCGGNKLRAAEMLGVSRSTLYRMLEAITAGERRVEPA